MRHRSTVPRFASLIIVAAAAFARGAVPIWTCTTPDRPFAQQPAPAAVTDHAATADVMVYPSATGQTIDGFGGCFNELGWKALSALPEADRSTVLRRLFGDDGCAFNIARSPIGASDYALDWYSLDDTPGDLALEHFSIDRDRQSLIPYTKAAMVHRPKLRVWASAWSPPAWMKDNNDYRGGHLKSDPATLSAYATYLAKYVEAYRSAGVDLFAVHVQNEPIVASNYPSCLWSGAQERDFIRDHLGPTFHDRHVAAQVWLGTVNHTDFDAYAGIVLADPAVAKFVAGLGYQWIGQQAIGDAHRVFPDLPIMQTESECHGGANSVSDAEHTFRLVCKYFRAGANAISRGTWSCRPGAKARGAGRRTR